MNMINAMKNYTNRNTTENGGASYKSTLDAVLDMFAFGASYRQRTDADVITLFQNAFHQDEALAMKCLFWIRDVRGGAGERRFFRVVLKWLAQNYPDAVLRNLESIPKYGRYDDLYCLCGTSLESNAMTLMAKTLREDMTNPFPTLAAKWAKSCNTSSKESRRLGALTRAYLGMNEREYRKMLSALRERLGVLERLMSGKRFDEIDFDKIPSVAGIRYSKCFASREELKDRYALFMQRDDTKVNAAALFPYDVACKAHQVRNYGINAPERKAVNKYWENLPNYMEDGDTSNFMAVCDTSGSMTWGCSNPLPIDVAVSLAIYFAEHAKGPFKDHYISFSRHPRLVEVKGKDFVEKYENIRRTDVCENTNLPAVFDMLLDIARSGSVAPEDFVRKLVIISDMEIDQADYSSFRSFYGNNAEERNKQYASTMERIRENWVAHTDIPFPQLYYWNCNCRSAQILDAAPGVSYISGANPSILKQVMTGKTGLDLMMETLGSERYAQIH